MLVMLSLSKTNLAWSCFLARASSAAVTPWSRTCSISSSRTDSTDDRDVPSVAVAGRGFPWCPPLWRLPAETRPQVHAFGSGEDGVEHQRGKERLVGCRWRVIRHLQVRRRALTPNRQTPLTGLLRFRSPLSKRHGARWNAPEVRVRTPQGIVGVDVADD